MEEQYIEKIEQGGCALFTFLLMAQILSHSMWTLDLEAPYSGAIKRTYSINSIEDFMGWDWGAKAVYQ